MNTFTHPVCRFIQTSSHQKEAEKTYVKGNLYVLLIRSKLQYKRRINIISSMIRGERQVGPEFKPDGALTAAHLRVVARTLPNLHDHQRLVAREVTRHNLTAEATQALATGVSRTRTVEEARAFIDSGAWRVASSQKPSSPTQIKRYTPEPSSQLQMDRAMQPYIHALTKFGYAANTQEAIDIIQRSLEMFKNIPIKPVKKNLTIIDEGYFAEKLAIIRTGYAFVSKTDSEDEKVISQIAGPLSVVGFEIASGAQAYEYTVEAVTNCTVQYLDRQDVIAAIKQDGSVAVFFLVAMALADQQRNTRMYDWGIKDVTQRIAGEVLHLIEYPEITSNITQIHLAQLAGCTREATSKALKRLVKQGLLYWDRSFGPQFVDRERLRQIYEQEQQEYRKNKIREIRDGPQTNY